MNTIHRLASGFRLAFIQDPAQSARAWTELMEMLDQEPYTTIGQGMMDEPYFIDDWMKGLQPTQLLYQAMQQGELFACMAGTQLAGIGILTNIIRQREATLEAWVTPEFRGDFTIYRLWLQLIGYCFRPLRHPDSDINRSGLGLRKLKAMVSANNTSAIKACYRLGFHQVGRSPLDGLFASVQTDMLMLELPNPIYFPGTTNAHQQSTRAAHVHATRAIRRTTNLPGATTNSPDSTTSPGTIGHNEPRRRSRSAVTPVAPVAKQPNESGRDRPVRSKLVRPEHSPASGSRQERIRKQRPAK